MSKQYEAVFRSYRALGLPVGSTRKQIRSAYRNLIKVWHPDVFQGDVGRAEEKVKVINAAFSRLKSASAADIKAAEELYRSRTTHKSRPKRAPRPPRSKPTRTAQSSTSSSPRARREPGARPRPRPRSRVVIPTLYSLPIVRRGRDFLGEVELTLREEALGARWKFVLPTCRSCGGWGVDPLAELETCLACRGLGFSELRGDGRRPVCPHCHGRGCRFEKPCSSCGGAASSAVYTAQFAIAPGIGRHFYGIVEGLGHPGVGGAPAGDLYLFLV